MPETPDMTVERRLRLWADELRAIADEGLHWEGGNPYNRGERGW